LSVKHGVCFAGLIGKLFPKKYNRMVYLLNLKSVKVPADIKKSYLEICTEFKLLPEYIMESDIKGNRYVIKLEDDLPRSLLYIYLTVIRFIQESAPFVKNFVTLVDEYKMSPYLAWLLGSQITIKNSWHNFIPYSVTYGARKTDILNGTRTRYSPAYAWALKMLVTNASKLGGPTICVEHKSKSYLGHGFNACDRVKEIAGKIADNPYNKDSKCFSAKGLLNRKINDAVDKSSSHKEFMEKLHNIKHIKD
jgi:hypothetical protein